MENTTKIRDAILDALLPHVAFDGWTMEAARRAAGEAGYKPEMADAIFTAPTDIVRHFADLADREMLAALKDSDPDSMKVRERIALASRKRLEWLNNHKEAERLAAAFWLRPWRKFEGAKIVWRTADHIWTWAGDTATDYNHYTKRALLSGVLSATTLYWLNGEGRNLSDAYAFLDRRIGNVLQLGKVVGGLKNWKKARA